MSLEVFVGAKLVKKDHKQNQKQFIVSKCIIYTVEWNWLIVWISDNLSVRLDVTLTYYVYVCV